MPEMTYYRSKVTVDILAAVHAETAYSVTYVRYSRSAAFEPEMVTAHPERFHHFFELNPDR